ncbi:hypothetical protein BU204_12800 [Actinophytocola xanthii]|uniref:Uncharacterized protein n=1 Tax=Actinophytocola xanthii TaxID=1912961 RepID=A0A1Q8CSF1_9PSEU|nr:hypothetical protein BU204_12800 [Actinophytocola xanthii]
MVAIGWADVGNLTGSPDLAQILDAVRAKYQFVERESVASYARQLFDFRSTMTPGDLVLLLRRSSPDVAAGHVNGDYQYSRQLPGGYRHIRPVRWAVHDIPRSLIELELRSVPSLLMVHQLDADVDLTRIDELVTKNIRLPATNAATVPEDAGELTPIAHLRANLSYARSLATAGNTLGTLKPQSFDVNDVFRAAWVQAVAGLDHWVRQELRARLRALAEQVGGRKPRRFAELEISLDQVQRVLRDEMSFADAVDEYVTKARGHLAYQQPDRIRDAFSLVTDTANFWNRVATVLRERTDEDKPADGKEVQARLADIVHRRNKIAHEYDEVPNEPGRKRDIDGAAVMRVIDWIDQLCGAILVVVDQDRTGRDLP